MRKHKLFFPFIFSLSFIGLYFLVIISVFAEGLAKSTGMFKDCEDCPEMVMIPLKTFAVGKFEITRAQFAVFVSESGHDVGNECSTHENGIWKDRPRRSYRNPGFPQDGTHPVVCVNWYDAKAYVKWLNTKVKGEPYRLLSDSEWNHVAGAKSKQVSKLGRVKKDVCDEAKRLEKTGKKANRKSIQNVCLYGFIFTNPVGGGVKNDFGLYDMQGNVWEWVDNCWHKSADGKEKKDCALRVLRGASWGFYPAVLRSADRTRNFVDYRFSLNGFRVAKSLE